MNKTNKDLAVEFLNLIISGKIDQAYQKYVDLSGKHHNPHTPKGFSELKKGMQENHLQFPHKTITIKNVLGDKDMVAIHSHLVLDPAKVELIVVHLFRFKKNKIIEIWDCGQPIAKESSNKDGVF